MATFNSKIKVQWNGSFNGKGLIQALNLEVPVSLPKEFGGLSEGTSPEDLFLSASLSCHLITLGIVLDKAGVKYQNLSGEGEIVTEIGPPSFIQALHFTIKIATDTPKETIEKLSERVDSFCLISKATKSEVKKTVRIEHELPSR
jgi:putative redox protein